VNRDRLTQIHLCSKQVAVSVVDVGVLLGVAELATTASLRHRYSERLPGDAESDGILTARVQDVASRGLFQRLDTILVQPVYLGLLLAFRAVPRADIGPAWQLRGVHVPIVYTVIFLPSLDVHPGVAQRIDYPATIKHAQV